MANTFTGSFDINVTLNEIVSSGGLRSGSIPTRFLQQLSMATGTADGQVNVGYYKRESGIGASVTTSYDLVGGLTDASGNAINIDEVVLIAIRNLSATAANYLVMAPNATNGFGIVSSNKGFWAAAGGSGGGSVIPADYDSATDTGSWVVLHSRVGIPAAAGSTDILSVITQSATSSNTWDIVIIGRDN